MPKTKPVITWDEENIYVNGQPYFIRGINYCGLNNDLRNTPLKQIEKDIQLLKDLNVNTIRVFADIPHETLDLFYKNNILVIMEIHNDGAYAGAWTDFSSQDELNKYIDAAVSQVERDKNHPAILMWCLWNDGPFGPEVASKYSRETLEKWLGALAAAVKKADPSRPMTSANMPGCYYNDLGASFLDVLGFNNYAGLHGASEYTHSVTQRAFDDLENYGKKYKKPIIITESGYSTIMGEKIQGKVIKSLIDAARTRTNGICIFQFADQWAKGGDPEVQNDHIEEYWGIVKADRTPKSGYYGLQEAYRQILLNGPDKAMIEPYIAASLPIPSNIQGHDIIEDFEIDTVAMRKKIQGVYTGESTLKAFATKKNSWNGEKSLALQYKAKSLLSWGCAVIKLDKPIPKEAKGIAMWVYRDGSLNGFQVQLEDADKDIWQGYSIQLGEPGWIYYVLDFSQLKRSFYGSSEDSNRNFDEGTVENLIFLFSTVASPKASEVYVDFIEYLY
jgi:exo-beta-1,3-glucanase (GH17 family)